MLLLLILRMLVCPLLDIREIVVAVGNLDIVVAVGMFDYVGETYIHAEMMGIAAAGRKVEEDHVQVDWYKT